MQEIEQDILGNNSRLKAFVSPEMNFSKSVFVLVT